MLNRQQVKESITYEWQADEWQVLGINAVEQLVDDIYDDFAERRCGNCRELIIQPSGLYDCQFLNTIVPKDFGCPAFERK